jgi:hypothetical protein
VNEKSQVTKERIRFEERKRRRIAEIMKNVSGQQKSMEKQKGKKEKQKISPSSDSGSLGKGGNARYTIIR